MAGTYTYPGVYVEEIPSGVRTIAGASTSDTAFVDFFRRGPLNRAVRITSFGDFERVFGGLDRRSEASYALMQYYLNGGQIAWVVRVAAGTPAAAQVTLAAEPEEGEDDGEDTLTVHAANPGLWGENLEVGVDHRTAGDGLFNLVVREVQRVHGQRQLVDAETHRNLSMDADHPRYAPRVIDAESRLIRLEDLDEGERPDATADDVTSPAVLGDVSLDPTDTEEPTDVFLQVRDEANPASDGDAPDANALAGNEAQKTGMRALDNIDPHNFSILCLPAAANLTAGLDTVVNAAVAYCERKRAFFIVDIPATVTAVDTMDSWVEDTNIGRSGNAAVYFPRLVISDPLNENRPRNVGASGTLAGIYARTDTTRGVWKAPAGTDAILRGARLAVTMNDQENGALNPLGINALRNFPIFGNISWGARTLEGADQQASEWKYIPVRRTALFIQESLGRGLKWVVFAPNDEPLWGQIRLNVGAFMHGLFRRGAFQGSSPREAYFVKCDSETTTQNDIDRGIVNIVVGFAPLKPAEFVVIKIQQIAGQLAT